MNVYLISEQLCLSSSKTENELYICILFKKNLQTSKADSD